LDISFFLVFGVIFLLIAGPFYGIFHLRDKAKIQQLVYRLKTINRLRALPQTVNALTTKKQEQESWVNLRNIILYFVIPIPPLIMVLLSHSIFAMFVLVIVYFTIVASVYFCVIKVRKHRYNKAFNEQFPNAIELVIRNLRAGRTIIDSIRAAGEEIKGPVAEQFQSIVDQVELGKNFIQAVNDLSAELKVPDFTFFGIVLAVQQETGGNIIKTLGSLVNMLRGRQLMRLKIKALSAEGIISAIFMGSLPFVATGIIHLIQPDYFTILFTTSIGKKMLMLSILSEITGCLVIMRTLHIEV